jgi:hypothetical protein
VSISAGSDVAAAKAEAPAKSPQKQGVVAPQQVNPAWQLFALGAQAKLSVSAPDDPSEREADHVADRVMRMPEPTVQRKCATCGSGPTPCPTCEAEKKLQRKAVSAAAPPTSVSAPGLGGGAPLDAGARSFFEPRFGDSFENVRVHTDDAAARSAEAMGARAFTLGRDIAFGAGEYQPGTSEGQKLIAHELTHVLQQSPADHIQPKHADDLSITRGMGPAINRRCVAGLFPRFSCCLPGRSWSSVGTQAHQQLQVGAGLLNPGTIGEIAIPPTIPFGWHYADLYKSNPSSPVTAPLRGRAPYSRFHPEINPYGLPIARVPPASPTPALIGEIKPLSRGGLTSGPAHLARNMMHYSLWSGSLAAPWSALPVIPGGTFGSRFNLLVAFEPLVSGAYNYCCLDARRVARAVARALRRAWEALKEIFRQVMEWIAENWELVLILVLVIIVLLAIIFFWAEIIAAAIALGEALLAFILWLLRILRAVPRPLPRPVPPIEIPVPPVRPPIPIRPPVRPPVEPPIELPRAAALVVPMREFVSSHMVASADAPGGADAMPDEEVEEAPESEMSGDPTVAPSLPVDAPEGFDALGEEAAAQVDALFGGAIESLREMLPGLSRPSAGVSGVGDMLLAGAPGMLAPLMQRMTGEGVQSEGHAMISDFLARAASSRPPDAPAVSGAPEAGAAPGDMAPMS